MRVEVWPTKQGTPPEPNYVLKGEKRYIAFWDEGYQVAHAKRSSMKRGFQKRDIRMHMENG